MGTCQNGGCEGEEENKSTESSKETEKKHIKKKNTENTEAFHIWLVIELLLLHAV